MKLYNAIYYHGSSSNFDKFDFAFMGSGQGAQAHGWGIYLAQDWSTAYDYRNLNNSEEYLYFDAEGNRVKPTVVYDDYMNYMESQPDYEKWISTSNDDSLTVFDTRHIYYFINNHLNKSITRKVIERNQFHLFNEEHRVSSPEAKEYLSECMECNLATLKYIQNCTFYCEENGMIATVQVDDDCIFAREDEDIFKQSEIVINALKNITNELSPDTDFNRFFEGCEFRYWYSCFKNKSPKEMSLMLLDNGVDGISYNGKQDGECLVLFNLDKCKIIKKE